MASSVAPTTPTSTSALVLRKYGGNLNLETLKINQIQEDELLVEVHASGICHSDVVSMQGAMRTPLPNVIGHEGTT
jgi:aryl-alcohol dehydrogenase